MKRILCLVVLISILAVSTNVWARGARDAEERVDRLVLALVPPEVETNRLWAGGWVIFGQFEPMLETLIGTDPHTGEFIPGLAREWQANDDFTQWTFYLRQGVPFHFDYGEMTAHDVKHTHELLSRPDSVVNMATTWRSRITNVEIVDDYTITFHFDSPYIDGERLFSRSGGELYIISKAHWDAEGLSGLDEKIVGTGAYRLVERMLGEYMLVEAVENHWRDTPEWPEIMIRWVPDDTTRLAMLVSGEAHAAELSRELSRTAERQGMVTLTSSVPSMQRFVIFGGLHFVTNGEATYDPDNPLIHSKVRQALIKAIDIEAIHEEIYLGRVAPTYRTGFVPYQEGWNPEWIERYDDLHGYDPEGARRLLAEAGYGPGEVKLQMALHAAPGQPEAVMVLEAMEPYWRAIGVEVDIQPVDFGAFVASPWGEGRAHGIVWISRNRPIRTTQGYLEAWHADTVRLRAFVSDFIEESVAKLRNTFDLDERDRIAREIGDYLYEQFAQINLGATYEEITVNPRFIADWAFPGTTPTGFTHYPMIKRPE